MNEKAALTVRPLADDTWPAFADLAERHNGVWGGCCRQTSSASSSSDRRARTTA